MVKVSKVKKRETSVHSRAHRRNASPGPDLTKGLPKSSTKESKDGDEHWMYNPQSSGVHKKTPKAKKLTRQQRVRQEKLLEHAERNINKHERKVEGSKQRGRKVQARRKDWDELNGVAAAKVAQAVEDGKADDMEDVEEESEAEALDEDVPQTMPDLEHPSKSAAAGQSAAVQPTESNVSKHAAAELEDAVDEIT